MLLRRHNLLTNRRLLGRWGEKRCEKFLAKKGLKILTRNFSCKTGELDLVMVDADGSIVFVEVRTKAEDSLVSPEQSITQTKKNRIVRAARYFMKIHRIENRPFRFDVVSIVLGQTGREKITHYENAFVP